MVRIHGFAYIAVGLFISIASWMLDYKKFVFFFYAGLIFVIIGIAKLIFSLGKNKTEKVSDKHSIGHKTQHQPHNVKYCTQCGGIMRLHDRFCGKCGASS